MSDYKETAVSGSRFNRCRVIEIRNPYQQTPTMTFTEEQITPLEIDPAPMTQYIK